MGEDFQLQVQGGDTAVLMYIHKHSCQVTARDTMQHNQCVMGRNRSTLEVIGNDPKDLFKYLLDSAHT